MAKKQASGKTADHQRFISTCRDLPKIPPDLIPPDPWWLGEDIQKDYPVNSLTICGRVIGSPAAVFRRAIGRGKQHESCWIHEAHVYLGGRQRLVAEPFVRTDPTGANDWSLWQGRCLQCPLAVVWRAEAITTPTSWNRARAPLCKSFEVLRTCNMFYQYIHLNLIMDVSYFINWWCTTRTMHLLVYQLFLCLHSFYNSKSISSLNGK